MTDEERYQEQLEEERMHEAWAQRQYENAMAEAYYEDLMKLEVGRSIWQPAFVLDPLNIPF